MNSSFLISEIKNNKKFIADSVIAFDSLYILTLRFNHDTKDLEKLLGLHALEKILLNQSSLNLLSDDYEKIEYLTICTKYLPLNKINSIFSEEIYKLIQINVNENNIDEYIPFAIQFKSLPIINNYLKGNFNSLISNLLIETKYINTFEETISLFTLFEIDIKTYINDYDNNKLLRSTLKKILEEEIENRIFIRSDIISSMREVDDFYKEIKTDYKEFLKSLFISEDFLDRILDAQDWEVIIQHYKFKHYGINN